MPPEKATQRRGKRSPGLSRAAKKPSRDAASESAGCLFPDTSVGHQAGKAGFEQFLDGDGAKLFERLLQGLAQIFCHQFRIAMGATGSDAAIESADVAFTGHDLRLISRAFDHARRGRRIINQNIILSLLIITALLPLALFGVLGLAAVVLVHEVAEVIVILNGLRAARTRTPRLES